jgi:putative salt-induced outer membrane protein YdiY
MMERLIMRYAVSIAVLCALLCPAGFADEVFLKNGDHLTGTIVRLTDSKLVLKSKLAGEVTLNLADIRTFSSEAPLEIHLKDGTVLHQPVAAGEPNQFTITAGEPLRPQPFALAQVASINPPPKPEPKWTGSISGSVSSIHGNTTAESVTGSVNAARRSEKDRLTASADYATSRREDPDTGDEDTTENWWRAKMQYDYFFTKKFFGFGNVRFEKDAIADLDRRLVVGGGAGYQWIETERTSFSTGFGLASLYEKFENATESNSELSLQAGYNLNKTIGKNLKFMHDLTYYPSLDSFSDYFLTTSAELRAMMVKNLFASFKVIFDYDTSPAVGRGSTDVKYLLGVGLTF